MNTSNSKMPISRQLRYEKQCRDNWKEKAAEKQQKIREYVQTTRALKKSRDHWKTKAKAAEQRNKELEKQLAELSSSSPQSSPSQSSDNSDDISDDHDDNIPHHHYTVSTISVVVKNIIHLGHSYRSTAKTMEIFSAYSSLQTPHYSSVKNWVERLGLYQLQRPKEWRNDWLYIVDLTVELGQEKALVIYGVSQDKWLNHIRPQHRALTYSDGEVLALEVTRHATGEWIQSVLQSLSNLVGIPLQIIGDHAPNLKTGIQLFQAHYPQVISTYDVSHAMALLLKKELLPNPTFQNFLKDCHHCRLQVQQTELAFAAPPAQRTRCRYFNIERLVLWANHILKADYSLFSSLLPHLPPEKLYPRLQEKFAWVFSYQFPLKIWSFLTQMTRTLEKQLKTSGLNSYSVSLFKNRLLKLKIPSYLNPFKQKLFQYLETEIAKAPHHMLLASSDILESIFGRYKYFSQRCSIKELRSLLLTIPLTTVDLTPQFIKDALTTIHSSDLSQWVHDVFGQSALSKRKILFAQ